MSELTFRSSLAEVLTDPANPLYAKVGDSFFYGLAPPNTPYPYVCAFVISSPHGYDQGGDTGLRSTRIQFDVHSVGLTEGVGVSDALTQTIYAHVVGKVSGGVRYSLASKETDIELYDSTANSYRKSSDFIFNYKMQ